MNPGIGGVLNKLDKQLIDAARDGDAAGVRATLAAGADVGANQNAALVAAAEHGHATIVILLLRAGAKVNGPGRFPLAVASRNGHISVVQLLLAAGSDNLEFGLLAASTGGYPQVVQLLLDAGADVNDGEDASLHWAAQNGHWETVQLLLDAGANVHADDEDAMFLSSVNGHWRVVPALLRAGAIIPPDLPVATQVAACASGELNGFSASELARRGACPDALFTLIERQGNRELAAMLTATQMLEPLEPEERAAMLAELLVKQPAQEIHHARPQ